MDFETFKENLAKDVKEALDTRTAGDTMVETRTVEKMNETYDAITVKPEDSIIGVNINATALYKEYEDGRSYDSIVEGAESILIKMTPEDINAIKAKMELAGIKNRSAYIRKMARDGYIINLDLSDIKEVIRLLRINSNNINQIAKKANETGNIYQYDIKEVQSQLDEIWEAVRGILERLANIS